jgi:hypothetical protein
MVEVEDERRWRLRVAGNEMVHKCLCEAIEIGAGHTVGKPGGGRGTRQGLGRIKGDAFDAQRDHGVVPPTIGLIALRIPRSDLIDTRREEIAPRMIDIRRGALVAASSGQALCEPDVPVHPAEQEGSKVGRQGPSIEISPHGIP